MSLRRRKTSKISRFPNNSATVDTGNEYASVSLSKHDPLHPLVLSQSQIGLQEESCSSEPASVQSEAGRQRLLKPHTYENIFYKMVPFLFVHFIF